MLNTVITSRFVRRMGNGRTQPCLIECEDDSGQSVEVVVKYSAMLMEREKNLALEAIVAMLAADLLLPVAEPFVVEVDPAFIATLTDAKLKNDLKNSCQFAFGSALKTGVSAWLTNQNVSKNQSQTAAEIAIFDQIIINSDRRPLNPNCLFSGDNFVIIDHELSFTRALFWREPWQDGGLEDLSGREQHIFGRPYFEAPLASLDRFAEAWENIPDARFDDYRKALPPSWVYDEAHIAGILDYLKEAKSKIRTITANALKVFS
ncbi:hypothetical protein CSQ94_04915 [Janthinobacterium sp. BJB312]|nr:hypothetical protein CSQ94_04915 [Janthinobacterium sp. BJB312]